MGKRIGTLLEKNIEKTFRLAGFNTSRNVRLQHYEVDVLAQWNNTKIIIQCKQYERSRLSIQDVIHEWNSKNQIIKADKVIIAVFGQDVEEWQRQLAKQFNIVVWGEPEIDLVETLAIEKRSNSLGEILGMLNLKQPIEESPKINELNIPIIVKIFGIILLLLLSIAFPPLIIIVVVIFIIWLFKKSKNKSINSS